MSFPFTELPLSTEAGCLPEECCSDGRLISLGCAKRSADPRNKEEEDDEDAELRCIVCCAWAVVVAAGRAGASAGKRRTSLAASRMASGE
mmetsp:Transcript_59079/g.158269  ORF Transcript_59079/g.158269 Transcript_59079/m.158269 type:complete len:90 (-) Transcript_59079:442-711(-)